MGKRKEDRLRTSGNSSLTTVPSTRALQDVESIAIRPKKYELIFQVPVENKEQQSDDACTSSVMSRDQRDEVTFQVLPLLIENPHERQ